MIVEFQDERDLTGMLGSASFQKAEWRGVGIAPGFDRQFEMVIGVITR
jgi:hypothetical protein